MKRSLFRFGRPNVRSGWPFRYGHDWPWNLSLILQFISILPAYCTPIYPILTTSHTLQFVPILPTYRTPVRPHSFKFGSPLIRPNSSFLPLLSSHTLQFVPTPSGPPVCPHSYHFSYSPISPILPISRNQMSQIFHLHIESITMN